MPKQTLRVHAALFLIPFALGLSGCSTTPPHPAPPVAPKVTAQQWVFRAYTALAGNDYASASDDFAHAIQSPDFHRQDPDQRYMLLFDASRAALRTGHVREAHALITRACDYKISDAKAWFLRFYTATLTHDDADQAYSLTRIAGHWPSRLHDVFPGLPLQLHRRLQRAHRDELDRNLLAALFDARWPRHVDGADYLWRDLVLIDLHNDELRRATRVALYITKPSLVLSMRVDKRFDPIVRNHPQAFNLKHLIATQIRKARARIKAHPNKLAPIQELQNLYIQAGRFQRALKISDPVLARVKKGDGAAAYTDFKAKYNWIIDNRARAYAHQGRWKRATHMMEMAARQNEFGQPNVSQAINLGAYYASLDQPNKAAIAIATVGNGISPYGRMQLERVRLYIAYDRKDKDAFNIHMAYLRAHRDLAIGTWQSALLLDGDIDQAAALMIKRLRNPDWRSDALLALQDYPDSPGTYIGKRLDANWMRMEKRKDVLAAVHKVGRIEHVDITP